MQGYNAIVVFDEACEKLLMCKRSKEPYKGKLNCVGGKIEPGEDGPAAGYRELWEETDRDFFNTHLFAGEGNIGHILMHAEMASEAVLRRN